MTAPRDEQPWRSHPVPRWFEDAKLGIVIHWGLYSVPAFTDPSAPSPQQFMADLRGMRDTQGRIPYAEWYLNALRVEGSATAEHHARTFGAAFPYAGFRRRFEEHAAQVDLDEWAGFFAGTGAGYVVMVARHLDGYPLWPTSVANPHAPPGYRSTRDLVGDLATAVRARGMRMGVYYAGGSDWTFTHRPVRTILDLIAQGSLGAEYARYARDQWLELIDRYRPAILWNDMGWPREVDPETLIDHYYRSVPDGVVNDRWFTFDGARPTVQGDFSTFEYEVPVPPPARRWEMTRGLGDSFGYDAGETAADLLDGAGLIDLLIEVVSTGGNLLVNVGPDGEGRIPEVQRAPLRELGRWLHRHREAVVGTRRRTHTSTTTSRGLTVRFTQDDDHVYAFVPPGASSDLVVEDLRPPPGAPARVLGTDDGLPWSQDGDAVRIELPAQRPDTSGPLVVALCRR